MNKINNPTLVKHTPRSFWWIWNKRESEKAKVVQDRAKTLAKPIDSRRYRSFQIGKAKETRKLETNSACAAKAKFTKARNTTRIVKMCNKVCSKYTHTYSYTSLMRKTEKHPYRYTNRQEKATTENKSKNGTERYEKEWRKK